MSEDRKKSLGEFLKSERERRGLTIEQTSSATKIGLKILKQLEEDRYSELPALPFVRGFVRNYGKFLGLDGEKLLAEYSSFLEGQANERPKRDAGHSGYAFERPDGEQSRKVLWGVMAGMLIFGGAVVFLFKPSLKRKHHGHIDKMKPGGVSDEGEDGPNPEASPVPTNAVSGTPSPLPSVVLAGAGTNSSPTPSATPSASASASATPVLAVVPAHLPSAAPSPIPPPEKAFIPPKTPLVLAPSPVPTAPPTPTFAPSPSPAPVNLPVSSPTPPAPSPSVVPSLLDEELKKDPLQSGKDYTSREIRAKIIVRTKADVWVRYRCDEKQLMKFSLKKDKILVLRGKKSVYFQVSNPDSITLQASGQAEVPFSQSSEVFDFHGNASGAFPAEARDKMEENFKVRAALPFTESLPSGQ